MHEAPSNEDPNPPVLGIDFGGTSVKLAVVVGSEVSGQVERLPTSDFDGADALIDALVDRIRAFSERTPGLAAVGIGVPGAVDFQRGMTYNLTNVPGWGDVPLRDLIAERTGLTSVLDNDANCMALAELRHGAAKGLQHAVCVTLGTGVGGGLIINGAIYRGARSAAGEIGQTSVNWKGVEGPYGNTGALERYIGHRQIADVAAKRFAEAGRDVSLEACNPEALAAAAREGDEVARQVWHRVADYLGCALANVVFLLNPEAIVIGGGVAYAGDVLFQPLEAKVLGSIGSEFAEGLELRQAHFGNTAGIIGSAALAADAHAGR